MRHWRQIAEAAAGVCLVGAGLSISLTLGLVAAAASCLVAAWFGGNIGGNGDADNSGQL